MHSFLIIILDFIPNIALKERFYYLIIFILYNFVKYYLIIFILWDYYYNL